MAKRERFDDDEVPAEEPKKDGMYFKSAGSTETFSSGSTLLDLVLGGGWARGRVSNVVGDRSTGKTLLAIEGSANYAHKYEDDPIKYEDAERAFDTTYAQSVGMPSDDRVDIPDDPVMTVEEFGDSLSDFIKNVPKRSGGLYILDSLDALTTASEVEAGMDAKSYGTAKAKKMSELFRAHNSAMADKKVTLMVISQLRDKIGVTFGESQTRSGGRALDFFASQIIWLANKGKIMKTKDAVKRPIGVNIGVRCKKNKVGTPFRECDFPIMFNYGIEDLVSMVEWLAEVKSLELVDIGSEKEMTSFVNRANKLGSKEYRQEVKRVAKLVERRWGEIEETFHPKRRKYDEDDE